MLSLLFAIFSGDPLASKLAGMLSRRRAAFREAATIKLLQDRLVTSEIEYDFAKHEHFKLKGELESALNTFPI